MLFFLILILTLSLQPNGVKVKQVKISDGKDCLLYVVNITYNISVLFILSFVTSAAK